MCTQVPGPPSFPSLVPSCSLGFSSGPSVLTSSQGCSTTGPSPHPGPGARTRSQGSSGGRAACGVALASPSLPRPKPALPSAEFRDQEEVVLVLQQLSRHQRTNKSADCDPAERQHGCQGAEEGALWLERPPHGWSSFLYGALSVPPAWYTQPPVFETTSI